MGCGAFCSYCGRCGRKSTDVAKFRVCLYCDYKNPRDALICENCGRELVVVKDVTPPPEAPPPPGVAGGTPSLHAKEKLDDRPEDV